MPTLKIPPLKSLEFARDYDEVLQKAEQQRVRARQMTERVREMCDHAAEMRAELRLGFPSADLDIKK